jgi:hypothetical protein
LEPAIREFGYEGLRMIDPACGSGHFLLGGFERLLREWQHHAPGMPPAAQAQRALDSVAGVDLNPFAVEISRFRLLLAALRAAGETRLSASPDFRFQLAAADSLLHGRHFARHELGSGPEGFRRLLRHHYTAEDTAELDRILGRQYHAVVGNPPYIAPKDPAMRDAYREIYESCYRGYGLGAPFIERCFDLALRATALGEAGYIGLIVANNFMKRDFGQRLIENVLPRLDLTHVINCDGVGIPGHGTPTAILFGRNRAPIGPVVRTVAAMKGDPPGLEDAGAGPTWAAILAQTDLPGSVNEYVSVSDTSREQLGHHPWTIARSGVSTLKATIEDSTTRRLSEICSDIGRTTHTGEDDFFLVDQARKDSGPTVPMVLGEDVRDYVIRPSARTIFPYDVATGRVLAEIPQRLDRYAWSYRTSLRARRDFGRSIEERGLQWFEHNMFFARRWLQQKSVAFAFVATHNHFVLDRGGKVFNRSAPVIKLPSKATENDHLGLLGLLNSSTACFWLKQVSHNKGSTVDELAPGSAQIPLRIFTNSPTQGWKDFRSLHLSPLNLHRNSTLKLSALPRTFQLPSPDGRRRVEPPWTMRARQPKRPALV